MTNVRMESLGSLQLQSKVTQTGQLQILLDFAFCPTEGCARLLLLHSGQVPLVLHVSMCQPRHKRIISAQNYTEGFVSSFPHILACSA